VRDDGGTGPLTSGSGRMGSKAPAGISGRKALAAILNKLTAIAQGPPMIIANASNMTAALAWLV
jgi:hypothetical protein